MRNSWSQSLERRGKTTAPLYQLWFSKGRPGPDLWVGEGVNLAVVLKEKLGHSL